ncbi:MAG: helix-turn-helix transcriptional regulator [Christensenellales bacterium]
MEENFKENLKQLRVANKMSQKDLANKLDTTVKTVSHWETGYCEPSITQIIQLCQVLDVSTDDLLCK